MSGDPIRRTPTDMYGTLRPARAERPDDAEDDYVDESAVFSPPGHAVPPVLGRYERDTGAPMMRYDDHVDEGTAEEDDGFGDGWEDGNGSAIDISF